MEENEDKETEKDDSIKFSLEAGDLMVPRGKMKVMYSHFTLKETYEMFSSNNQTSLLVCKENIDQIIGAYDIHFLLRCIYNNTEINLKKLNEVLFITESTSLARLLNKMLKKKIRLAVVVDEFGSTKGMITYESLIKNIYKNLFLEEEVTKTDNNELIVRGQVLISNLDHIFSENIFDDFESDTIGGVIIEKLGRMPFKGEKITINNIEFVVIDVNEKLIENISVKILED